MILNGNLQEFILADIFQILSQHGASGILTISSGQESGYLVFQKGDIVSAR
ncbi:MAG: DUF4388 domain-containing protein, partial [bacterium]|nr:DUF4388 domain-containing protein [bacterium]